MMRLLSPQLQAFITVAKLGTVHAAAHALHITQTGITQRIKSLENDISFIKKSLLAFFTVSIGVACFLVVKK